MRREPTTDTMLAQPWRLVIMAMLGVCGVLAAADFVWLGFFKNAPPMDFFGIWSFARFVQREPAAGIYQPPVLQAFQDRLAPGWAGFFPCPYPPGFLAVTSWLGLLPIGIAKAAWTGAGVLALSAAGGWLLRGRFAVAALLLSPASILNGGTGETGYFVAAALMAGLAWLPTRPYLAGLVFGLLSLKPQFLVLVPFAFLARRDVWAWCGAVSSAAALGLFAGAMFGPGIWLDWAGSMRNYQNLVSQNQTSLDHLMTTIDGALLCLHAPAPLAWSAQIAGAALAGWLVWICFRHAPYRLASAVLLAATPLAAPHALVYDAPVLAAAMLLTAQSVVLSKIEMLVVLAACMTPLFLVGPGAGLVILAIPECLVLAIIIRAALWPAIEPPVTPPAAR